MQEQTQVAELASTQTAGYVEAEKKGTPQSNGIIINRFNAKLARTHWKRDCGDVFKWRGQMFKSSGTVVPNFRSWLNKARRLA